MQTVRVPAFAKVNLRLEILGRRADRYHELRTIFQTLTLHDALQIGLTEAGGIGLRIRGDDELAAMPAEENLVWRALDALKRELKIRQGIRAELRKRIPAGRGLGGGSSDAAAAMAALVRLCGKKIEFERLMEIASGLGADVPYFLFGGRALGISRGNEIYPLEDLPKQMVLVVSPRGISVATREAYGWLEGTLTSGEPAHKLWSFCALCWRSAKGLRGRAGTGLHNDFEAAVFQRRPRLAEIKRQLLRHGAADASLAGSGSAVFGIFSNPAKARRAARKFPEDAVFLCTTLSRKAYLRAVWGGGIAAS